MKLIQSLKKYSKALLTKVTGKQVIQKFPGSKKYWENRYAEGGNSGAGSYDKLAEFKAKIINEFVMKNDIQEVIEFGCGDGNQLSLMNYPLYIGLDVSKTVIDTCNRKFKHDKTKRFLLIDPISITDKYHQYQADLTLSLDIIFHLIEDEVYEAHMNRLFNASTKYVIIYSSNVNHIEADHVKDRSFTDWIQKNIKDWVLLEKIDNKYKLDPTDQINTSRSDFYFYLKSNYKSDF